jgi:hypothetical protein
MRRLLLFVAAAAFAGSAAAASIEEAQRIVDRAEPLHCEIYALEQRLKLADAGSDEHAGLTAKIGEAKKTLKFHYLATMSEYIAVMKELPFEERKVVYAYSDAVADRCAAKAGRDAPSGAKGYPQDKKQTP